MINETPTVRRLENGFPRLPESDRIAGEGAPMPIRRLSEDMVNRIAAGEVVEREE